MTNRDYIMNIIFANDRNLANILTPYHKEEGTDLLWKIQFACDNHFEKNFKNKGNCKTTETNNQPCYWTNETAYNLDHTIDRNYGRTKSIAMQVWLTLEYNPTDWEED